MDELMHALRIKGRATPLDLAGATGQSTTDVQASLMGMAERGLAVERTSGRRPGWLLTSEGRDEHARAFEVHDSDEMSGYYDMFLKLNNRVKTLCASWQNAADEAARFELLEDLHDVQEAIGDNLIAAGEQVSRFARYRARLADALAMAPTDPRYVVSPVVDSYHTVWFELHEDFILTLGRSRSEEGSW